MKARDGDRESKGVLAHSYINMGSLKKHKQKICQERETRVTSDSPGKNILRRTRWQTFLKKRLEQQTVELCGPLLEIFFPPSGWGQAERSFWCGTRM